ncbi:phosphorylcholine transferase LicD1 [Streptococcus pneumoniae]|nr:phosphorylcholine transferase LicD1 [Streptococcus pneumoniae]
MKQLTVEDAKQIELEILDYIDTLCKKHNINYIINYGTLIGAVRHEGFIPWDDDIDLSMPREDYQRFINIFQKEKSKYELLSLETDKNYFNNFIKITDSTTKIMILEIQKPMSLVSLSIFSLWIALMILRSLILVINWKASNCCLSVNIKILSIRIAF